MFSFLESIGFIKGDNPFSDEFHRSHSNGKKQFIEISEKIFNEQDQLLRYVDHETLENAFIFREEDEPQTVDINDDDLPF